MVRSIDTSVLVVGAGVAGLAAATTLANYGIDVVLVERRTQPSKLPRATVISTRSMEVLRAWGLADEVRAAEADADVWMWESETLTAVADGRAWEVGYPSRAQAAVVSPCAPATVSQDWLEAALSRNVGTLPSARIEVGADLVTLQHNATGVRATARRSGGDLLDVRAQFVIAADGAHSAVRRQLGVPMRESGEAMGGAQVVFRAPLWDLLGDRRYGLYWVTTPDAPGLFLPTGRSDRWVYAPAWARGAEKPTDLEPARIVDSIRRGAGVDVKPEIERIGGFRSPAQLADQFRVQNVFLTGDAAHRVTPRGGTGMNMALLSAYDLGWKLAWVLRGWADEALLNTYERERRAVGEHNIARSIDPSGSLRPVLGELAVDLGGRMAHAWLPSVADPLSTLDLLGPGLTLFAASGCTPAPVPASQAPIVVRELDAGTARALGVHENMSLLVRPDGVPVAA